MLTNAQGFTSFSVDDLAKAKQFYGETLGLEVKETKEGLELTIAQGYAVFVYPKSNHTSATYTVLNFKVSNLEQTVDGLTAKGIQFEQYNEGPMKTNEKGIVVGNDQWPSIAWFKDPAGNFISLIGK